MGSWVHDVTPAVLRADAVAGLLGALFVLLQGMAFALLAGLPPQYELYTAIVPCVIAGLFWAWLVGNLLGAVGRRGRCRFAVTLITLVSALVVRWWDRHRHMLAGLLAGTAAGWLAGFFGSGVAVPLTIVALAQSISIAKAVAQRSG